MNKPSSPSSRAALRKRIGRVIAATPVTDMHTHLYTPQFGGLLLRGIDALLTYHYLVAETFRWNPGLDPEAFFSWPVGRQAARVWQSLFIDHSPVSESCRGVLTALQAFKLNAGDRSLDAHRRFFAGLGADRHIDLAMKLANVECLVMTNDPFDDVERPVWDKGYKADRRFRTALRIDTLFTNWPHAAARLNATGFRVTRDLTPATRKGVRAFLEHWIATMKPVYMMASLPPDFILPSKTIPARIFEEAVLPLARERNLAFAMMIGCKRQINPALRLAGDGVANTDMATIEYVARQYPDNKFLVTLLARENQHALCVIARKFRNILPFGCWWFLNSPVFINEITRMRLEWLGLSMMPQHSDARVLDQIIYKWNHTRNILVDVLVDKYGDIEHTGWKVSDDELRRDVAGLLGGAFWQFLDAKME